MQVYATVAVRQMLEQWLRVSESLNAFNGVLWTEPSNEFTRLIEGDGAAGGLYCRAILLPGEAPVYVQGRPGSSIGHSLAYQIMDRRTGARLLIAPDVGEISTPLVQALDESEAVLFDGTFWSDTELLQVKPGARTAWSLSCNRMTIDQEIWDPATFEAELRAVGTRAYHDKHPFHQAMNAGELSPEAIRGWVANRFYYQRSIPLKDAAILSNCPLREVRRSWRRRIVDHDGSEGEEGGIEAWLRLGEACGLCRDQLLTGGDVVPGVRFAVDAYVTFARTKPWPIAVASSLTELFAPDLMAERLKAFRQFYPWVQPSGFDYFERRLTQARRDSTEGLLILNDTAHAILRRCNGAFSIADILEQLADEYGANAEDLQPDVLQCLRELQQRQLVTF